MIKFNNVMRCFVFFFRYLGLESRFGGGSSQGGSNGGIGATDGMQPQFPAGTGVIGPASAERNCKNIYLTPKQQSICSRFPPVLQVIVNYVNRFLTR